LIGALIPWKRGSCRLLAEPQVRADLEAVLRLAVRV
jgi:hypothetical protein